MPETSKPASIFPVLKYDDAPAAVEWLRKAFGFAEHAIYKDETGGIAHAQMALGDAMVMFSSTGKPDPANPWSIARQGICMHVPDIDAHYARAKLAGVDIVRPLAETSYGGREYSARDPGGYLWSFGTYDPWQVQA